MRDPIGETPDILGTDALNPIVVEQINLERKLGAADVLSKLALQDGEYLRRQSQVATRFLVDIVGDLPRSSSLIDVQGKIIQSFNMALRVNASGSRLETLGEETLEQLNAFYAGVVWVKRDVKDVVERFDRFTRRSLAPVPFAMLGQDSVYMPHIIVGSKTDDYEKRTELLLLTLADEQADCLGSRESREEWPNLYHQSDLQVDKINQDATLAFNRSLGSKLDLRLKNRLIKVSLPSDQLGILTDTQRHLLSEGLSAEQAAAIHNSRTGNFIVNAKNTPVIKLDLTKSARPRRSNRDAAANTFYARLEKQGPVYITPQDFLDFQVLATCQVTAAFFGATKQFEISKEYLELKTHQDPTVAWFNNLEQSASKSALTEQASPKIAVRPENGSAKNIAKLAPKLSRFILPKINKV